MEDDQYPDWLWGILKEVKGGEAGGAAATLSKKQAKKVAKQAKKRAAKNSSVEVEDVVPINEQSIDLPVADGTIEGAQQALDTSRDLTKALRAKRRAAIREANFLRTMR